MFTGLVEAIGEVRALSSRDGGGRLDVATALAGELADGDSVAVNGVCLTVVARAADGVAFDLGFETLRVTTLGGLRSGMAVNLERPLRADGRIGGHFVLGHVDGVGTIVEVERQGDSFRVAVEYPAPLAGYLIPKGSVAVDGISLTVAALEADRFDVQVIPFTWDHTTLSRVVPGSPVNLECDVVGKYVVRAAALAGQGAAGGPAGSGR